MSPLTPYISLEEKQRLSLLLKQEASLAATDEGLLRSIVDRWPWFHDAWILLALWEKQFNPTNFLSVLPGLSLSAGDNSKLAQRLQAMMLESSEIQTPTAPQAPMITPQPSELNDESTDRTAFLESLVKKRLAAIAQEKAAVGYKPELKSGYKKDEIIERFIREEPRIRPRQDISPDPDEKAERSLQDENTLVSETLARIHEKQGNYQKAIEIYRSLSLKYPQKSTYFAAQIEKLQEKLKP